MEAAEKSQCGEFLDRLEQGIHTPTGDGGKQLSGGERQRISLARAILKNAPIIVLDEATAFMDPENEEKMTAAIAEVIAGKTVIVIAHRLNTIRSADKIMVIDGRRVTQAGRHEALMEQPGTYRDFVTARSNAKGWNTATPVAVSCRV